MKEHLGQVKNWGEILEKINILLGLKIIIDAIEINAIEIISKQKWDENKEDIIDLIALRDKKHLKEILDTEEPFYCNSQKYDLYILETTAKCKQYKVLVIVYYKP